MVRRHYKRSWMLIGSIGLQHVGVLSVYVVHGLMCVAFLGWLVPLQASNALVLGTYGQDMRMKTSSPKTWRREVLESHLGLSRGTTSSRRNLYRPGHHLRLAENSLR